MIDFDHILRQANAVINPIDVDFFQEPNIIDIR